MTSLPNLICRSALGPTYQLENRTGLHILGPETHLVVEGQEIALICRWMISIMIIVKIMIMVPGTILGRQSWRGGRREA